MSGGYAERLTFRPPEMLGGTLGDPETFDNEDEVERKVQQLAQMVRESKRGISVYTGAGISTSCGIPDFRGPNGIWTLQAAGKPLPSSQTEFALAEPSLTHMALLQLVNLGKVKFITSQNVDSLHLRSGVPSHALAELHGNCFLEKCHRCKRVYERDFEIQTVGFKFTGRSCEQSGCRGRLKDFVLDWDDALPEDDLLKSEQCARETDLALCLGTSLRIAPACEIPLLTKKSGGGKVCIVNLQKTPKDKKADLKINAKSDRVMSLLMDHLEYVIPRYSRTDSYLAGHRCTIKSRRKKGGSSSSKSPTKLFSCKVFLSSSHGSKCPIPSIESASVTIAGPEDFYLEFKPDGSSMSASFQCTAEGSYTAKWSIRLKAQLNPPKRINEHEYQFTIDTLKGTGTTTLEGREAFKLVTSMKDYTAIRDAFRKEREQRKKQRLR